jgi:class 3 adenylate cyclase
VVSCAACGHENPDDASFCGECGASLAHEIVCPGCGRENPPGQKFCHGCGRKIAAGAAPAPDRNPRDYTPKHLAEKILRSKSALEGERKQVTVLFVDVKGSMELAERVDPEEWHGILDRFFQILTDGVHRFEGTVNRYTGDGIMALFGAPIAHEDHAQRACYAALHLRDALRCYADELRVDRGLSFAVRMGLNSGDVIVGKIGDDLRMDYTAQGHTVGLAQRMEQLAASGHACLTEHTARLVEGFFQLRALGQSKAQDTAEPFQIFELEDVGTLRTRLDLARARGFSRFVGRHAEMEILEHALARSLEGAGQVVGIVGEAGVGKSRLCHELAERCRARGIGVTEGTGFSHGRMIPLLPVLAFFRAVFGITDRDPDPVARERIAERVRLLEPDLADELPLLFDSLGLSARVFYDGWRGETGTTLASARRSLEIAKGTGVPMFLSMARFTLGDALRLAERWQEALEAYQNALDLIRTRRVGVLWETNVASGRALVYSALGDHEKAIARARSALEESVAGGNRRGEDLALLTLARVLLATGKQDLHDEVERTVQRAETLCEQTGMRVHLPHLLEVRATLADRGGKPQEARQGLHEAHRLYVEMGATGQRGAAGAGAGADRLRL